MKTVESVTMSHNGHILRIAVGTALILAIPFIAMQFSDEVQWGLFDFIVIGALLFGAGLAYELISRKLLRTTAQRLTVGLLVVLAVVAVWVELAVGIFD